MKHEFYETDDKDAPDVIKDSNGEVCLALCKVCDCTEASLPTDCPGYEVSSETEDRIQSGHLDFVNREWVSLDKESKCPGCKKRMQSKWAGLKCPYCGYWLRYLERKRAYDLSK